MGSQLADLLGLNEFRASEDGEWLVHEDVNPNTGRVEAKRFWLVQHDGLVFESGWHRGGE